jgi:hypothetical protein
VGLSVYLEPRTPYLRHAIQVHVGPEDRVLELGCAEGLTTALIATAAKEVRWRACRERALMACRERARMGCALGVCGVWR